METPVPHIVERGRKGEKGYIWLAMEGFKRSVRNEQAIQEQRNWAWERDDWPVWQRAERTNLQWRIYCSIQEQRYEDISDLEDAMIAEQHHLHQQWDSTVQERRWSAADRFSDVIHRQLDIYIDQSHNGQGQMTTPNRTHQQIKIQSGLQITHGPVLVRC